MPGSGINFNSEGSEEDRGGIGNGIYHAAGMTRGLKAPLYQPYAILDTVSWKH